MTSRQVSTGKLVLKGMTTVERRNYDKRAKVKGSKGRIESETKEMKVARKVNLG